MLYTSKGSRIVKTRAIEAANVKLLLHLQIAKKFDVSRLFEKRINFPELFNTYTSIFVIHHTYGYFVCLINKMLYQNHICSSSMLYGTAGEGRGQKSKYTVLPRGGRVQFDFWNGTAGWPIDPATAHGHLRRPRPVAGLIGSAAQQESLKNKTVVGHPAVPFQKSNCTRPPRGRTVYFYFWPRPPPSVPYRTDFKFIGKVESQTNIFLKSSVLAHFTWTIFKNQ